MPTSGTHHPGTKNGGLWAAQRQLGGTPGGDGGEPHGALRNGGPLLCSGQPGLLQTQQSGTWLSARRICMFHGERFLVWGTAGRCARLLPFVLVPTHVGYGPTGTTRVYGVALAVVHLSRLYSNWMRRRHPYTRGHQERDDRLSRADVDRQPQSTATSAVAARRAAWSTRSTPHDLAPGRRPLHRDSLRNHPLPAASTTPRPAAPGRRKANTYQRTHKQRPARQPCVTTAAYVSASC